MHAAHAGGIASHGADVVLIKADGLAVMGSQENDLLAVGEARRHQFITFFDVDGDDAHRPHVREILQVGLLHGAVAGGEEHVFAFFLETPDSKHGAHGLTGLQAHEVSDMLALAGSTHVGNFVHFQPVDAPSVGEDENVGVG